MTEALTVEIPSGYKAASARHATHWMYIHGPDEPRNNPSVFDRTVQPSPGSSSGVIYLTSHTVNLTSHTVSTSAVNEVQAAIDAGTLVLRKGQLVPSD